MLRRRLDSAPVVRQEPLSSNSSSTTASNAKRSKTTDDVLAPSHATRTRNAASAASSPGTGTVVGGQSLQSSVSEMSGLGGVEDGPVQLSSSSSSSLRSNNVVRFRHDADIPNGLANNIGTAASTSTRGNHNKERVRSRSGSTRSSGGDDSIAEAENRGGVHVRAVAAGDGPDTNRDNDNEDDDASSSSNNNTNKPKWSKILRSPTRGEKFSPSRELTKASNLHGLGLRAASERARTLSKCGKRSATLLADVAALHDGLAGSILQSCRNLAALEGGGGSGGGVGAGGIFSPTVSPLLRETNRCLISFAKQTQGLAICLKGSVARPLHGSSSAMAEAVPGIFNRYALTRAKCASARQNALRAQARYERAVAEAEEAIATLRRAKNMEEGGNDDATAAASAAASTSGAPAENGSLATADLLSWEDLKRKFVGGKKQGSGLSQSSQLVLTALKEVQNCESDYCRLVEEENQAVSRAQTMEIMALDSLQKLEEERLQFLVETLGRALQAERGALDKMVLVPQAQGDMDSTGSALGEVDDAASAISDANMSVGSHSQVSSASILNKVLPSTDTAAGKSAVQEAIELNLPEDVGRWRDTMNSRLQDQMSCTHALKAVAAYFMEIASAAFEFSTGLRSKLSEMGYVGASSKNKSGDVLAVVLNQSEGDRALASWNRYIETLGSSAKAASDLGSKIQEDGDKLIGKLVSSAEKDLRSAVDSEEMRWKHCTDHAKAEAKARLQHEQSVAALEKAEERMAQTAASFASSSASISQQYGVGAGMSSPMTKAIGGMLSMLPSGMEDEALTKMLNSEQRLALAKKTLEETTAKQQADKLAYESAQIAKEKAIQSYVATARAADNQAIAKAETLWSAVTVGFEVIVSFFQHFRETRYVGIDPAATKIQEYSGPRVLEDLFEWSFSMQQNVFSHIEEVSRKSGASKEKGGYMLKANRVDSKDVYKLLQFVAEGENGQSNSVRKNTGSRSKDKVSVAPRIPASTKDNESTMPKPLSEQKVDANEPFDGEQDATMTEGMHRSSSMPVVAPERMSVATKELKNLAETLKVATAEKAAPESSDATTSAEMQLFLAHFGGEEGQGKGDGASGGSKQTMPPTVIDSYSCAYWPKEEEGFMSPLLHGRMFVTSQKMYFIGWGDKKLILKWEDVASITKDSIGPLDNSIRITFDAGDGESSYFFGSFAYSYREKAFQLLNQLTTVATQLSDLTGKKKKRKAAPIVPPDENLAKMDPVLSKRLAGVSLKHFYDMCWSEGNGDTDSGPFYHKFLESKNSHDISVGEWEVTEGLTHPWSGEKMDQKRIVKYKFTRTTHLYVGPPIAGVTQTQYCRMEGDDKFVLTMTVEMDGIPYADCFAVEVRWVARRAGKDLVIDVGVFVDFKKSTVLKAKIQSGTITETKPIHFSLFDAAKEACGAGDDDEDEEEENGEKETTGDSKSMAIRILQILLSLLKRIVTSGPVKAIVSKAIVTASSALQNTYVRIVLVGLLVVLAIAIPGWILSKFPASPLSHETVNAADSGFEEKIRSLDEKTDSLSQEVSELRNLLLDVLSKLNTTDGVSLRAPEQTHVGDEL